MIAKPTKPDNVLKASGTKGQGYARNRYQKVKEDNLPLDEKDRAYAKSSFDAPPIDYNETGNKI